MPWFSDIKSLHLATPIVCEEQELQQCDTPREELIAEIEISQAEADDAQSRAEAFRREKEALKAQTKEFTQARRK